MHPFLTAWLNCAVWEPGRRLLLASPAELLERCKVGDWPDPVPARAKWPRPSVHHHQAVRNNWLSL